MKAIISILMILFVGCGYKPSSYYQKEIIGNKIYVNVNINVKNPKDSLFLKDAVNQAVIDTFGGVLSSKEDSTTQVLLSIKSVSLSAIDFDNNGYPILYRVTSSIATQIIDKNKKPYSFTTSGTYDFAINPNSVVSDNLKHIAIRQSLLRALGELSSKVAITGMKSKDNNETNSKDEL